MAISCALPVPVTTTETARQTLRLTERLLQELWRCKVAVRQRHVAFPASRMYKEAETGMRGGIWTLTTMELSGHSMKGNRVDRGTASCVSLRAGSIFLFPPLVCPAELRVLLAWDDGDSEQNR